MYRTIWLLFFIAIAGIFPLGVHGASLSLSTSDRTITIGQSFTVDVIVESNKEAMNAASVALDYPHESLEFVSFSRKNSIFFLWPIEPVFSKANGTINFEGFLLNPGYQGPGGHILSMTFVPRKVGDMRISFKEASVLANDGYGTELLTSRHDVSISVRPASSVPPDTKPVFLPAPTLLSPTHPIEATWYTKDTVTINAVLPEGVTETHTILDPSTSAVPSLVDTEVFSGKTFNDVEDGIYYFSLQYKTLKGVSDTARFKIQIDTTSPEDFIPTVGTIEYAGGTLDRISFEASDAHSGISHFTVSETSPDGIKGQPFVVYDTFIDILSRTPGAYTFEITAFDYAGNSKTVYFVYNSGSLDESFHNDTRLVPEDTPLPRTLPQPLTHVALFLSGCVVGLLISYSRKHPRKHKTKGRSNQAKKTGVE